MKFGQLIENNLRNIFLENYIQNVVEKLVPDPFLKNEIEHISGSIVLKFHTVCFYCTPSWGLSETKMQTTCFYLILNFYKKQKQVWN